MEVSLLCVEALDEIARALARKLAPLIPTDSHVALATPALLNKLRVHREFTVQVDLLHQQVDAVLSRVSEPQAPAMEGIESMVSAPQVAATEAILSAAAPVLGGIKHLNKYVGVFLKDLQINVSYTSLGKTAIPESVLKSTIAGRLLQHGIKVLLPDLCAALPQDGGALMTRLNELWSKKQTLAAMQPKPDEGAKAVISLIEAYFAWAMKIPEGGQEPSLLSELLAIDGIADRLAKHPAYLLLPEITVSGGSAKTRETILGKLFSGKKISYSGGIAVSFLLLDKDAITIKFSDTLYFVSGYTAFPKRAEPFLGNNLANEL